MNYNPDYISTSIKIFSAMTVSLIILYFFYYWMKKGIKRNTYGGNNLIKILSSNYIGVKKRISLIEIPGLILVLGIANDNHTLKLAVFDSLFKRGRTI